MAGMCSSKASLCALLFLKLAPLATAEGHRECGHGAQMNETLGKCICSRPGFVMDADNACCPEQLIDWKDGELFCFEEPDEGSLAVAGTLILSFTFLISMQFWTESKDADMRKYGYKVISATVSIFTAVLMFQCIDGVVDEFIISKISKSHKYVEVFTDLVHFFLWYTITQFTLAIASQAVKPEEFRKSLEEKRHSFNPEDEKEFAEIKLNLETNCASYGVVCAHLTGFAAINAWTGLQQCEPFNSNPWFALLPLPICVLMQFCLQRITERVRLYWMGDNDRDMFENKWDEQCADAENDVLGLTMSVMVVNSVRMGINGWNPAGRKCLPNQEQKEEGEECTEWLEDEGRGLSQILMLALAGLLFCGSLFFVKLIQCWFFPEKQKEEGEEEEEEEEEEEHKSELEEVVDRITDTLVIALGMCFSWCSFHANKEFLQWLSPDYLGEEENATLLVMVLAFEATYFGWLVIKVLDKLYDLPEAWTPPAVDASLVAVIDAIALFIGFAWEQTFDESVNSLANKFRKVGGPKAPAVAKLVIGSAISFFIFKSWKKFTIPFIVRQGWDFGFVFSAVDLPEAVAKLKNHHGGYEGKDRLKSINIDVGANAQSGYQKLPGEEEETLRVENHKLLMRLKNCEQEKVEAQQSLDKFMENMLQSLKGMNDTVTRLESK